VDNFPSKVASIPGPEVAELLWTHLDKFPPFVYEGSVEDVAHGPTGFNVAIGGGQLEVRGLVLATGTHPRTLGVPGEELPWVTYSWTDIRSEGGGKVAIIGGGDLAVDQALSLRDAGFDVVILVRSGGTLCNRALQLEIESEGRIPIMARCSPLRFEDRPQHTIIVDREGKGDSIQVDHVLVSIGREPELPRIDGRSLTLEDIEAGEYPGLFLTGDIIAGRRRQVAIAFGSGLEVAMRCEEFLRGKGL
jgi:thioredoxin reductase (NADPH)